MSVAEMATLLKEGGPCVIRPPVCAGVVLPVNADGCKLSE